jgi:hypothetical protein
MQELDIQRVVLETLRRVFPNNLRAKHALAGVNREIEARMNADDEAYEEAIRDGRY